MPRFVSLAIFAAGLATSWSANAQALELDWDGGGGTNFWGNNSNWDPAFEPDDNDDLTIAGIIQGAGPHTVLDTDFVVSSLAISNSSEVDTNNFLLAVEGKTTLTGQDTRLRLFERTSGGDGDSLDTDALEVGSGSTVEMYENSILEVDSGLFEIAGSGHVIGNGTIELADGNLAAPTALLSIQGFLTAGEAGTVIGAPPARTLTITAPDANARIDMFLVPAYVSVITVQDNATLINEVRFDGDWLSHLRMFPNSTYQMEHSTTIRGTIIIDTNPFSGPEPASITAGEGNPILTLGSFSDVLIDFGEQLRFDVQLFANDDSILANEGTVIFDAPAQFGNMADFQMNGGAPRMIVNSNVTIAQDSFDIDGTGFELGEVTVNEGGLLTVNVDDFGSGDLKADGTININAGEFMLNPDSGLISPPLVILDGILNLNGVNSSPAVLSGTSAQLAIGDSTGASDANIVVGGVGFSVLDYSNITFNGDADVDIDLGATLDLEGSVTYNGTSATFDGNGTLRPGRMVVDSRTTFNVAVVDLDDEVSSDDALAHELRASLIVNTNSIDNALDGFDGQMVITHDGATNFGQLRVVIPPGSFGRWSFDSGEIRLDGPVSFSGNEEPATMLSGSIIEVGTDGGTLVSHGLTRSTALLEVYGAVELADTGSGLDVFNRLYLAGGSLASPNRMEGGVVTGIGRIVIGDFDGTPSALAGFGAIDTQIIGNQSRLVADDGRLYLSETSTPFFNLAGVEVTDDGKLAVETSWNTDEAGEVVLGGGSITGGRITNNPGIEIRGHGIINAPIDNDSVIRAQGGGTLVLDPVGANSDYDGPSNAGELHASTADLVLRNVDSSFNSFRGEIIVGANREFLVEGFGMSHHASAAMTINPNGVYRATNGLTLNGALTAEFGSQIVSTNLVFGPTSTTQLDGNLEISTSSSSSIDADATFSGPGNLVVADQTRMRLRNGAEVDVRILNHGNLGLGTADDDFLGTASVGAFTQTASGELAIQLSNVASGTFDVLTVENNAILDGTLVVQLFFGFEPVLGNSFGIIETTVGNIGGEFVTEVLPEFNGLTFDVVYSEQSVVLEVVEAGLPGDFDGDDNVDGFDFIEWQRGNSPDSLSAADLMLWENNFNATNSASASRAIPEADICVYSGMLAAAATLRRRSPRSF